MQRFPLARLFLAFEPFQFFLTSAIGHDILRAIKVFCESELERGHMNGKEPLPVREEDGSGRHTDTWEGDVRQSSPPERKKPSLRLSGGRRQTAH